MNFQSESATTRPSSNLTNAKNSPSKLANYKDSLKDKAGQMKKMLNELKQAQEQVTHKIVFC